MIFFTSISQFIDLKGVLAVLFSFLRSLPMLKHFVQPRLALICKRVFGGLLAARRGHLEGQDERECL